MGTGAAPASSWRYSRWSAKFEKKIASPDSQKEPPPYSCTFVPTLKPGVTSLGSEYGAARTITRRPLLGRPSIHSVDSPESRTSDSETSASASIPAEMGDGHAPERRSGRLDDGLAASLRHEAALPTTTRVTPIPPFVLRTSAKPRRAGSRRPREHGRG